MNRIARFGVATLASVACSEDTPNEAASSCAPADLIVAMSDGTSSSVAGVREGKAPQLFQGADLGGDPSLSVTGSRVFLLARTLDTLFELNPSGGCPEKKIPLPPISGFTGSTNPWDVAALDDGTLFVPRYNKGSLAVLRPDGTLKSEIDLSTYDVDGNPEASAVRITDVNGTPKLFVTLERLERQSNGFLLPVRESWMLRIDALSRAIEATIPLAGRNPFNAIVASENIFYLAEPGNFYVIGEPFAGIERFDPLRSETRMLVGETDLGGSVSEVAISASCGAAIVADASDKNATALAFFDPASGTVKVSYATSPLKTADFDLRGLAFRGSRLYVGDRTRTDAGYPIHQIDLSPSCEPTLLPDTLFVPQKPITVRAAIP